MDEFTPRLRISVPKDSGFMSANLWAHPRRALDAIFDDRQRWRAPLFAVSGVGAFRQRVAAPQLHAGSALSRNAQVAAGNLE